MASSNRGPRARSALLLCGSLNQTTQMHQIGRELRGFDCRYAPFWGDGVIGWLANRGALDFTVIGPGSRFRRMTDQYLHDNRLPLDPEGRVGSYDLVVTCSDLVIQDRIRQAPIVL